MIKEHKAPLLVDCLNCEKGCNCGPGTNNGDKAIDEVEYLVEQRNIEMQKTYRKKHFFGRNIQQILFILLKDHKILKKKL